MRESNEVVDRDAVLRYFAGKEVLSHYEEATLKMGLWKSEELIFRKEFPKPESKLLELGCGTGRIAFALYSMGYCDIVASDFSSSMIRKAKEINRNRSTPIRFEKEDATKLSYEDGSFDGIIFGFNGLMQIPGRLHRLQAISEAYRVLVEGGKFVFTSHDRFLPKWKKFWVKERQRWRQGKQNPELLEFGDRYEQTERGKLYLHVPEIEDLRNDLRNAGFLVLRDFLRSKIANESALVNQFSDECRFWICQKPN